MSALSNNVSYTFKNSAGVSVTASFIDGCNSHPTPISGGYTWHYHAVSVCVTNTLDAGSGPSHLLEIALDGYPIYGGPGCERDHHPGRSWMRAMRSRARRRSFRRGRTTMCCRSG